MPTESRISADDLRAITRAYGLVEIPEHLMDKVLEAVQVHRASMRRFVESGIDITSVAPALQFRAGEAGGR